MPGRIGADGDSNLLGGLRLRGGGERKEGDGLFEWVIAAMSIIDRRGHGGWGLGGIGAVVVDGGQPVRLFGVGALADGGPHEYGRLGRQFRFHNHIRALSHPQGHHVGGIRSERNEVIRHHRHRVVIDGESENGLGGRVDES